jgi:hypothetical protein
MIRKALRIVIGGLLALMFAGLAPRARASEFNQSTKLTFSQPLQLLGNVVLPAGTYWFEVPVSQIVQVFNSDHTKVLATLTTIATQRCVKTMEGTQLALGRMPQEFPMLLNWVYSGQIDGYEFVYSRQKNSQLSETGSVAAVQIPNGGTVKIRSSAIAGIVISLW